MNGSKSLKEYFAKLRMTPLRANVLDAIFVLSILTSVYFLWKGPVSFALQSVSISFAAWYIKRLETEISDRNQGRT